MQVLQGYMQVTLADAQSITVLRAVQKGNAPSLVAALACDTAAMYQAAAQAFNHFSISSQGSKAAKYAEWKRKVFQGYMYAFTGVFTRHSCIPLPWLSSTKYQSMHSVPRVHTQHIQCKTCCMVLNVLLACQIPALILGKDNICPACIWLSNDLNSVSTPMRGVYICNAM